ncbi:hypothetical protein BJV82DRAFT_587411 [Fennellomyces sp. T-0311]|nr:hypothetical protein BJV82DRAFT_587411 [Fennellomyces sp. T-0311]
MSDECTQCQQKLADQAQVIEELRTQLQAKDEAMERLQQDMHTLNQKYVAGIERVADVQYEKALVEHELEELSTRLFEEANGMVAQEKRERFLVEQQLQQTVEHLAAEQSQLQELRERITQLQADHPKDPHVARARHDLQQLHNSKRASANNHNLYRVKRHNEQRATSMPPLPSNAEAKQPMSIDQVQLEAFREFVRSSPDAPFKKLFQFVYMKVCQTEDVEPCLRFGPHSRLSTKKMNEFLSRQPCFIEQLDEASQKTLSIHTNVPASVMSRPLWERFSSNHPSQCCSACGRPADQQALAYRFRLDEMDDWAPIDQYCRDRLVAVCEFYVFIRNIQKGFYADRDIDDLYTENIRLRLQMFYSR